MVSPLYAFRIAQVFADAILDPDLSRVSASRIVKWEMAMARRFNAASTYPSLLKQASFVFFGDTNHFDPRLHPYFYSQQNIDHMANANIRHIFPEIPPAYQSVVTAAAHGVIIPKDFSYEWAKAGREGTSKSETPKGNNNSSNSNGNPRLKVMAEGFARMHESGMTIHCFDRRSNLPKDEMKAVTSFSNDFRDFLIKNFKGSLPVGHTKAIMRFIIENAEKLMDGYLKALESGKLINVRSKDDAPLAARMLSAANDEKGAIFFGSGHAHLPQGLCSTLGQDETLRIDLYASMDMYADRMSQARDGIQPNYAHILDEDKLYEMRPFSGPRVV